MIIRGTFTMHSTMHFADSLTMYGLFQVHRVFRPFIPQLPHPLTFSRTDSGSVFATFRGNKRQAGSTTVFCSLRRFIACTYRAFSQIARAVETQRAYQVP